MEKINSKDIISALILLGFEHVDSLLFSLVLGKVIDNKTDFEYSDELFTEKFITYLNNEGNIYGIDENLSKQDQSLLKYNPLDKYIPIGENTSKNVLAFIRRLDFRDIILRKIRLIGVENLSKFMNQFCDLEVDIMYGMLCINPLDEDDVKEQLIYRRAKSLILNLESKKKSEQ